MTEENETTEAAAAPPLAVPPIPLQYKFSGKWDAFVDLGLRRLSYSTLAGAFTGLLFFRSPATRWASVAFGAGIGLGSAYAECAHKFDTPAAKLNPNFSEATSSKVNVWGENAFILLEIKRLTDPVMSPKLLEIKRLTDPVMSRKQEETGSQNG